MAASVTSGAKGRYKIVVGTKQELVDYIEANDVNDVNKIKIIQFIVNDAANDIYTLLATFN